MSSHRLTIKEFLISQAGSPILDIRSPGEYENGHIPGSHSFPLFSNEERAEIGTIYKQIGQKEAILRGFEITGPKMAGFIRKANEFKAESFRLYCWRGGMRSESMSWLLRQYGFNTSVLEGGYKAYRNHVLDFFKQPLKICVISGNTGSSKTALVKALEAKGEQVIDLEGLANHQGSSFGKYKQGYKPDTEQFQNKLFDHCHAFDLGQIIWVEDEGKRVGKVSIVDGLFEQMQKSPHVEIHMDLEDRLNHLVSEYGKLSKDQLIEATVAIRKKLGYDQADLAVNHIENGQLRDAAAIILSYYDKRYEQSIAKKKDLIKDKIQMNLNNINDVADQLIKSVYAV